MTPEQTKTKEVLIKARSLIENPDNWIKGRLSDKVKSGITDIEELKTSTRFCASGAIYAAMALMDIPINVSRTNAHYFWVKANKIFLITKFNDHDASHDDILHSFDKAIDYADKIINKQEPA